MRDNLYMKIFGILLGISIGINVILILSDQEKDLQIIRLQQIGDDDARMILQMDQINRQNIKTNENLKLMYDSIIHPRIPSSKK